MTVNDRVRIGGLMRCCMETLQLAAIAAKDNPVESREGDRLACRYCRAEMVYRNAAWEWDGDRVPAAATSSEEPAT